jgi:MoxR-like ATPase
MVLATQNPVEQEGTYPLPEAQLDRFLLKLRIDYPQVEDEVTLLKQVTGSCVGDCLNVNSVQTVIQPAAVQTLQKIASTLQVDDRIHDYAVRIVRATRSWPGISLGAGPRGSIALIRAARGAALLDGRDFVLPDDIKRVAPAALRHRISLAAELEIEGHDPDGVLTGLLEKVETPRM